MKRTTEPRDTQKQQHNTREQQKSVEKNFFTLVTYYKNILVRCKNFYQ